MNRIKEPGVLAQPDHIGIWHWLDRQTGLARVVVEV